MGPSRRLLVKGYVVSQRNKELQIVAAACLAITTTGNTSRLVRYRTVVYSPLDSYPELSRSPAHYKLVQKSQGIYLTYGTYPGLAALTRVLPNTCCRVNASKSRFFVVQYRLQGVSLC